MAVDIPCGGNDGIEFLLKRAENRIGKAAAVALFEFLARQFDGRHSLADVWLSHGVPRCDAPVTTAMKAMFPVVDWQHLPDGWNEVVRLDVASLRY
jgi:hypothetical protein